MTYNKQQNTLADYPTMAEPDLIDLVINNGYVIKYNDHLASLRSIPCHTSCRDLWEDGKEYVEGKDYDFWCFFGGTKCGCANVEACIFPHNRIAVPLPAQQAGDAWLQYIKQFSKLDEFWSSMPEPTKIWLSQQIDIFAGKYPAQQESQEDMWKEAISKIWASQIMSLRPTDSEGIAKLMAKTIERIQQHFTITRK